MNNKILNTGVLKCLAAEQMLYEGLEPAEFEAALVAFAEKIIAYQVLLTTAKQPGLCGNCEGRGVIPVLDKVISCPECNGTGKDKQ